ncbi:hypothetical protein [Wenyingzhuangia sp. IMCC45574]
MKIKKNPKANLENYSGVFTLLGLVLTLYVSFIVIEHKSYAATKDFDFKPTNIPIEETETMVTYKMEQPKIEQPKMEPISEPEPITVKADPTQFKKTEDDVLIDETPIATTDPVDVNTDLSSELDNIDYVPEEATTIVDNIPLMIVESAPVFPGCEKYEGNKEKSKKCFSKKMSKFFNKHFDNEVANDLNLYGIQSINSQFVINSNGEINPGIRISKTHPEIAKEIKRVLKKLPKMKPAKYNGKKVNLIYALPVKFMIE